MSVGDLQELRNLMDPVMVNHQKINCIKSIRAITKAGLKEAKDFFEQEWMPFINGIQPELPEVTTSFNDIEKIKKRLTALEQFIQQKWREE